MNVKLEASQASIVFKYQNVKIQLMKTCLHIKFNKQCIRNDIIPTYAKIKINSNSIASQIIRKRAEIMWIKEEIKQLYIKKVKLNKTLYRLHLNMLNIIHPAIINNVSNCIDRYVTRIVNQVYYIHRKKLNNLLNNQRQNDQNINCKHTFYPRICNLTDIHFDKDEIDILSKCLKFNIPNIYNKNNHNKFIIQEIVNTEAAIKMIRDDNLQNEARILANIKFNKHINNFKNRNNAKYFNYVKTLKCVSSKLRENNALITKADKGDTLVIMHSTEYIDKVNNFITSNNIKLLNKDPTKTFVKQLNNAIGNCKDLCDDASRRYLKPLNAKAPQLTGLPKIHKLDKPIRPLVNFTTAPGFKTAKKLTDIIRNNINIQNNHSLKSSLQFVNDIKDFKLLPNYKIASFDIVNLYTNIPINDTLIILKQNLESTGKLNGIQILELMNLLDTFLRQNYFTFDDKYYIQEEGLAMGSPLSGLLSDIYLNHYENTYLFSHNNKFNSQILFYRRYVDDTFMIFNGTIRQIENLRIYMNSINKNIQFTSETETNYKLNFLDLTIIKQGDRFQFKIYRKPTTTDLTISADSHHPTSHKMAAYNSFIHRLLGIPLNKHDFEEELNTIKYIAVKNGFKSVMIDKLLKNHQYKKHKLIRTNNKPYVSALYTNLAPKILTNTFNKINYKIGFRTNNNILKILQPKKISPLEDKTGVYKLTCDSCNSFYIGQTGRSFQIRFNEHIPGRRNIYTKNSRNNRSNYARHLMSMNHNYTSFSNNLKPLHICIKSSYMNAVEELEIYKAFKDIRTRDFILNDQLNFQSNSLYDTAIKLIHEATVTT